MSFLNSCVIIVFTSPSQIADHQQSGELYQMLLLDLGHLYTIKIEGVLEQIPEGRHSL